MIPINTGKIDVNSPPLMVVWALINFETFENNFYHDL